MTVHFHQGDLPDGLDLGPIVAVDSETMGLRYRRDALCVVQLSDGQGDAHLVQLDRSTYDAPNLKRLLSDPAVTKIFHFGRFDIAMFYLHLGVDTAPVYCTKIASKLARTYTDRHGLKDLVKELLGVELSKAQQSSDWGAAGLSEEQVAYAASDVLHLHLLRAQAYIDEHLGEPALGPAQIAAAHYISTRHLHGVFHERGESVSAWIRTRRLERSRGDLLDPLQRDRMIGSIATRWGFVDAAHFSRLYKAAFDESPSETRARLG